jgi:hypothetical protein
MPNIIRKKINVNLLASGVLNIFSKVNLSPSTKVDIKVMMEKTNTSLKGIRNRR